MDWVKRKIHVEQSASGSTTEFNKADSPPVNSRSSSEGSGNRGVTIDGTEPVNSADDVTALDEKNEHPKLENELSKSVSAMSNDDNIVYPKGLRLVIITISLCFAVFLVALDQTIIATAMYPFHDKC